MPIRDGAMSRTGDGAEEVSGFEEFLAERNFYERVTGILSSEFRDGVFNLDVKGIPNQTGYVSEVRTELEERGYEILGILPFGEEAYTFACKNMRRGS